MTNPEPAQNAGLSPFTQADLGYDTLTRGAEAILDEYYQWRDGNPDSIAEFVEEHTVQLEAVRADYGPAARARRRLSPSQRQEYDRQRLTREIEIFGVYNLGEVPKLEVIDTLLALHARRQSNVPDQNTNSGAAGLIRWIKAHLPVVELPEMDWFGEQMDRLHRILPESVVRNGGMGKAVRIAAGVLAIGTYDTIWEDPTARVEHLSRILPAAYAFGALHPIIDDTLQDGHYFADKDRWQYDEIILEGLRTGGPIDTERLPDHPLAEELVRLFGIFLERFPFGGYRHLYQAGEAMYLAQDCDSRATPESVALHGLTHMYPDIIVKSAMSRVIPNILGRRSLSDADYTRGIGINFINQLGDDLQDRLIDRQAGRVTPFSYVGESDTNPLHDYFAYGAFMVHRNYGGDKTALKTMAYFNAGRLSAHVFSKPGTVRELQASYALTPEMVQFVHRASGMPRRLLVKLHREDFVLRSMADRLFRDRRQTDVDPRTFISDRLAYINGVIREFARPHLKEGLGDIISYSLDAGGKRLRPALTLMVAEGLNIPASQLEPLLAAVELFHTSSLVFDDLPAQDNATLRRGRPSAHIAFGEAGAQLAGVSMISSGFGILAELKCHYPTDRVNDVIEYFGSVLGPKRLCLGQDMDLRMERSAAAPTSEQIIKMYELKTSTMIEAAMMPVLMLTQRPVEEMRLVKEFARHAGIVYQVRDDILDATATSESLGKDAGADLSKVNLVRVFGMEEAQRQLQHHLATAVQSCRQLPFSTHLLQNMVKHFATRNR